MSGGMGGQQNAGGYGLGSIGSGGFGSGGGYGGGYGGQPQGGYGQRFGGYGGMQGPRMMQQRPMQQGPQFSSGGGDPYTPQFPQRTAPEYSQGGQGPTGGGDPRSEFVPQQGSDMMAQMMSKVGGYGMNQSPQGQSAMPMQAPQSQFSAGGGDPYTGNQGMPTQAAQVQNMADGPQGGIRVGGFAPPGVGGYTDPSTGWNMNGNYGTFPSHPPPPRAATQTPNWAAQNPAMYRMLYGSAAPFAQETLDARGPWFDHPR
jgi:hypothetical protein